MILAVAYKINDSLVGVYNDGEVKSVGLLLVILVFGLYGGTITWIVYQYIYFSYIWTNILIISITVFFSIGYTVCLLLGTRNDISILTNGFVILYATYLSWSALAGRPEQTSYIPTSGTTIAQILTGLFFTLIALFGQSAMSVSGDDDEKDGTNGLTSALNEKSDPKDE